MSLTKRQKTFFEMGLNDQINGKANDQKMDIKTTLDRKAYQAGVRKGSKVEKKSEEVRENASKTFKNGPVNEAKSNIFTSFKG